MARTRKGIWRMLAAALGLAIGILGSEATFGQLRPRAAPGAPAILYSIELRNGQGDVLATPMVVGQEGRRVHLDLAPEGPHSEPLAMSLDLDPRPSPRGVCLNYELSVEEGVLHHGQVDVPYGLDGGLVLLQGGGHLWLRAARAHTAEFKQLLALRAARPAA
jgi:hypothetical protein